MISCVVLNGTNHAWPQVDQAFSSVRFTGSCGYKFEPRFADIRFVITDIFLCSWTTPLHFNPLDKDT